MTTLGETQPSDFYTQALAAFRMGDYREASRLAGHAAIDQPQNAKVHLLLSLALFATGDYPGAATEAHAVAALEPVPDWNTVYGIYQNVDAYTRDLRTLEAYVRQHPKAPDARFLLGFQYMIDGHRDAAQAEFAQAVKLEPKDRLAEKLLTENGGAPPLASLTAPKERTAAKPVTPPEPPIQKPKTPTPNPMHQPQGQAKGQTATSPTSK